MADSGQLICILAGPPAAVDLVKPFCKGVMGRENIDFGGQVQGKATLLKVIGNTFILQMVEALSEGHTLAGKTGLGTDNMHALIEAMFPGPYTAYSNRLKSGDYYKRDEPLFAVDLARKDAKHALDLAASAGAKMRAVEVADAHLADVKEHMGTRGDIASIYGAVRQESGLKFENQSTAEPSQCCNRD
jgi:3-hydroxyisobutyrate dehydrogenase-like beta-hydroxyacid dehydrogenase